MYNKFHACIINSTSFSPICSTSTEEDARRYLYSCGSTLKNVKPLSYPSDSPQTKSIFERVFVRKNLNCEMPMEITYRNSLNFRCKNIFVRKKHTKLFYSNFFVNTNIFRTNI